mgnify:FL=1
MHLSDPIDQDEGSAGLYQPRKILVNDTHAQLDAVHGERSGWAHRAVARAKELTQHTSVKVSLSVVLMGVAGLWWWEHCRIDANEDAATTVNTEIQVFRAEQNVIHQVISVTLDDNSKKLEKLEKKIDDLGTTLNQKIDQNAKDLNQKMDHNTRDMNNRFAEIMALLVQKHSRLEKLEREKAAGTLGGP